MSSHQRTDTVVLDVDGTLVDTVYHHTLAWSAAFAAEGVEVPLWRIHRAIGMGGDRLVAEVAGHDVEDRLGDTLRSGHDERFEAMLGDIRPTPGAEDLLRELRQRELKVVLASSGPPELTERLLRIAGADELSHGWTTSGDVEDSKPAPDLVDVAVEKVDGSRAVMVGDAVWDIKSAKERDRYAIGLLCGGFGEGELREAGADEVYASPRELLESLDLTPLTGMSEPSGPTSAA